MNRLLPVKHTPSNETCATSAERMLGGGSVLNEIVFMHDSLPALKDAAKRITYHAMTNDAQHDPHTYLVAASKGVHTLVYMYSVSQQFLPMALREPTRSIVCKCQRLSAQVPV